MKRLLCALLSLTMLLGLFAVSASAELAQLTNDEITLRYACWGQAEAGEPEVLAALIAQFEEAYPNITVEFVAIEQSEWNTALTTLAAEQNLPDVFWVFNVAEAVANEWALDLTEFYETDPDVEMLYPAMVSNAKIAGKNYSYPVCMFPHMVFLNKTLFEKYNMDLPSYDWTWEDYFEIAEKISHPEEYYYGVGNPLYQDLFPAAYNGNQGKFGWDGTAYHFDKVWVDAVEKYAEVQNSKISAVMTAEEKESVIGDPNAWLPAYGRVAMQIDWPWTIAQFENEGGHSDKYGFEMMYYPLPLGPTGQELAIVDNGVISPTTKYPREAWELAKWMTWGPQAALTRQATYRANGNPVSRMPVVKNEEVWLDLADNAADNMKGFFENMRDIVPSNWPVAAGWSELETYFNENDILGKIERGEIDPADVASELETKGNEARDKYLQKIGAQ